MPSSCTAISANLSRNNDRLRAQKISTGRCQTGIVHRRNARTQTIDNLPRIVGADHPPTEGCAPSRSAPSTQTKTDPPRYQRSESGAGPITKTVLPLVYHRSQANDHRRRHHRRRHQRSHRLPVHTRLLHRTLTMPDDPTTKPVQTTAKCPRCKRDIDTKQKGKHRVLRLHGPDPTGEQFCRHSGGPVPK